jgi:hypothetical protein
VFSLFSFAEKSQKRQTGKLQEIMKTTQNMQTTGNLQITGNIRIIRNLKTGFHFKAVIILLIISGMGVQVIGQTITQTVRGRVYDQATLEALPFSTVLLLNSDPVVGTVAGMEGDFMLEVPVGRRDVQVSMVGYERFVVNELLVSSGKEIVLNIGLQKSIHELEAVTVRVSKDSPVNTMTTLSARQFTVEETQRYAGGMDDPARLATAFAGVASPSVGSNGISVRGNNPDGLLWKIEGVEVPGPNHFANLKVAGGGLLTALSNQMMSNSDFYTGAFPAEFGNASSGVFDIKLNSGNSARRQYTLQAGVIGVDLSAQGPFKKGRSASYIMNYRNSTMALVAPLLPDDAGIIKYQDLSFKINVPTAGAGTFSLWGLGALDGNDLLAAESADWETDSDRDNSQTSLYMYASGLSHRMSINPSVFISTTLSASGNGLSHNEQRMAYDLQKANAQSKAENNTGRYTLQTSVNKRFGEKHTNKTGVSYSRLSYDIEVQQSVSEGAAPVKIAGEAGTTGLAQAFSQSKIDLTKKLTLNLGVNALWFAQNNNLSVEPRAGIKYAISSKQSVAFAYGLHSRIEQLPVYFVEVAGAHPNKELDLMKSTHYVMSYNLKLKDNVRLCVEPYYQHLTGIPVAPGSYVSTINNVNNLFFGETLVNEGTGRNVGIDFTVEQFLTKGFYYLLTASVFDSRYTAADGIERNTRFNKNYVINVITGKEWQVGKNNMLSANVRLNYLGGNRKEPVDILASMQNKKIIYGETGDNKAFSQRYADVPVLSFTLAYRTNKPKYSSVWSLQLLNATGTQEFSRHLYNIKTESVDNDFTGIVIPNLSYRIEF